MNNLNHQRFETGHKVSPISNFEVDLSEDVTGPVPLQIFKGIKEKLVRERSSQQLTTESTFSALLWSLEKEGEQKVVKALKDPTANATTFLNIVKEGADEFQQKTGRPMTYSEMREMYG